MSIFPFKLALFGISLALPGPFVCARQTPAGGGVPVHLVVTAEAHRGSEVPDIAASDVQVYQNRDRTQLTDWVPLQGDRAGLQFFVLIDDTSQPTAVGSQLDEVRRFIESQPPTTAIGVGYARNGTVEIAQNLTSDHAAAAKVVRLPMGNPGAFGSVYLSTVDLIKRWPENPVRREMLLISDGIDQLGGTGPSNPYVDSAVEQAQRAGIIVFTIYTPGFGRYYHSFWRMNWGQIYLSQLSDETGGASYFLGFQAPVSFGPYLEDIQRRLNHQYLLAFLAKPPKKSGLETVRVKTEVPHVELVAADRVFVPVAPQ